MRFHPDYQFSGPGIFRATCLSISMVTFQSGGIMRIPGFIRAVVFAVSLIGLPAPAAAVEVGDKAPDFELISTKGGNFKLSDMAGKKAVLVQFYVLDFSPT